MKPRFAIDLLWVRYGKIGGGVAVVINLLDGLIKTQEDFEAYLIITEDNLELFERYSADSRFKIVSIESKSDDRKKTVWLQNIALAGQLKKHGVSICLEPDNYIPILRKGKVDYITVIHDLQALHYPDNFSRSKRVWLKINWINALAFSKKIIAISEFTKNDIINHFHIRKEKITVVYDPININEDEIADFSICKERFGIEEKEYFYTVSSMGKNKNLETLLDMMKVLKQRGNKRKLVISGIGEGEPKKRLISIAEEKGIEEQISLTGFVNNDIRNTLYKHCAAFLFPSVFEGFGMPPLEANLFGARVITTKLTSIPEATQNSVEYVEDAYDGVEWANKLDENVSDNIKAIDFSKYEITNIAEQYLKVIDSVASLRQRGEK